MAISVDVITRGYFYLVESLLTPTVHTHPMYLSYKVAKLPKVLPRLEVFGKWPEHCARQARVLIFSEAADVVDTVQWYKKGAKELLRANQPMELEYLPSGND